MKFESTGWSHIDIGASSLDKVETEIERLGFVVTDFDLALLVDDFREHARAEEYSGVYRLYGGAERHCFLEKALEHFLSFELAGPGQNSVGIDIGSCKSVAPAIARRMFGARVFEQDLVYPSGVNGDRIGSSADAIPLPAGSIDFMMLHCTFEHFEGEADTGFVRECARLLKPGGRVVILPLYLNANFCNVTGETEPGVRDSIAFDRDASFHCVIPEWQNRFGRHYSPHALRKRVLVPAREGGLAVQLMRAINWELIDPSLWLRWILVLSKPTPSSTGGTAHGR